jgi:hypothetical protein
MSGDETLRNLKLLDPNVKVLLSRVFRSVTGSEDRSSLTA